jgi:DNA-binding response OmpR family regulator
MNSTIGDNELPRVLVVEDDLTIQMIVRRSLEKSFSVVCYNNGIDALSYLQDGNLPDMIIADLNTPEMGGLELIDQLKSSGYFNGIPVLVLSGEESTETRIKCLDAGADDYVVKPFNPRELEARMKAILRRIGKIMFQ